MNLRVCLLISDDPDELQTFSEAIDELSPELLLINVPNADKALKLLRSENYIADYVVVDSTTYGLDAAQLCETLQNDSFSKSIQIVVLIDEESAGNEFHSDTKVLQKTADYAEFRDSLKAILTK